MGDISSPTYPYPLQKQLGKCYVTSFTRDEPVAMTACTENGHSFFIDGRNNLVVFNRETNNCLHHTLSKGTGAKNGFFGAMAEKNHFWFPKEPFFKVRRTFLKLNVKVP